MNDNRELCIWEKNHIEVCQKLNLFEGKDVLEVGGVTPQYVTDGLKVKSWTCVDTWSAIDEQSENYKIYNADIACIDLDTNSFDLAFSTNTFEHIQNLEAGINNIHRLVRPEGHISSLWGPIWSCAKGHHLFIPDGNGNYLTFNDDTIPHWGHLIYSEDEIREKLKTKHSEALVNEIIESVYGKTISNKLFYEDYIEIINNMGFEIVELRDWHTPILPDEATLKTLQSKYGDKNFSTISIKALLKVKK